MMSSRSRDVRSHLFTLRVWPEEVDSASIEWRGKVQYVPDGDALYFRDWQAMVSFLRETLDGSSVVKVQKGRHGAALLPAASQRDERTSRQDTG